MFIMISFFQKKPFSSKYDFEENYELVMYKIDTLLYSDSCGNSRDTVEHQWLEHLWNHENMFGTGVVRANECYSLRQVRWHNRVIIIIFFFYFLNMKVCCVFSLESPDQGDSNEYTQYTVFNIKKKITLNYPKFAAMGFFQGLKNNPW